MVREETGADPRLSIDPYPVWDMDRDPVIAEVADARILQTGGTARCVVDALPNMRAGPKRTQEIGRPHGSGWGLRVCSERQEDGSGEEQSGPDRA